MPRRGSDLPLSTSSSQDGKNKSCCSCCCWLWVLLGLGVACLVGGLTWYFVPEDAKQDLPSFPGLVGSQSPTSSPAPTVSPTAPWRFHQCQNEKKNCCQGLDDGMCDMRVNEILYGYMHNAVHTIEDDFLFPWNHELGLEKALDAGYRALELDVGRCGSQEEVVFYHSRCGLGTRDPTQVLQAIGEFVAQNPTEIVILLLQMPDIDVVSLTQFDDVLQAVPTVANHLYAHSGAGTPWPTLQELIDADQRVVMFFKNQPDCRQQTCPSSAWHYWNDYAVETEWEFRSVEQIDDTDYSCAPNRGTTAKRDFYRVNAFVSLPSQSVSETLNDYEYAQARMTTCAARQGQPATFYAVDFWDQGDVLPLVQDVNRQRAQEKKQEQEGGERT